MKTWTDPALNADLFVVPVCGFFADPDHGVGVVHLPDEFHTTDPAARLGILSDWQRALAALHTAAFVELYENTRENTEGLPVAARRQAFELACSSVGQAWPAEVGALIQRDLGTAR